MSSYGKMEPGWNDAKEQWESTPEAPTRPRFIDTEVKISANPVPTAKKVHKIAGQNITQPSGFEVELSQLINRHNKKRESNTPDYILAEYLVRCLQAFNECVSLREQWYGRRVL